MHKHDDDYLLFLEHNDVYTCGSSTKKEHLKDILAKDYVVDVDRGGSVTYHGPGQLVGYPIITIGQTSGDLRSSLTFIRTIQEILIEALDIMGVPAISKADYTGVWYDKGKYLSEHDRYVKIAAIGVKVAQGRTRHGFALNISPDLTKFEKIIPCGINEYGVASLHSLGFEHISMDEIIETISKIFIERMRYCEVDMASTTKIRLTTQQEIEIAIAREKEEKRVLQKADEIKQKTKQIEEESAGIIPDIANDISRFSSEAVSAVQPSLRLLGRLSKAGISVDLSKDRTDRPAWMKNKAKQTDGYKELKGLSKGLGLHTVCEEAGCPNIYECWESRTATFMILGSRCTRACSFCLVDTRKPLPPDPNEPTNVAVAVKELGLEFAVITCVTRDDLDDDGSNQFAQTLKRIRELSPSTQVELLISDNRGKTSSLETIFNEMPDIINHNIETVARLQKAVRPSASYARSLSVLARAKAKGLTTKSGMIVGMGETKSEVFQTLRDLRNVGVDIVTIGQYLQPTPQHLPVHRFVEPSEFESYKEYGEKIGITHVESGPLVRSSYHAKDSAKTANIA